MDRDLIESYVVYGIKSSKFVKGTCFAFLLLNAIFAVIEINIYPNFALMRMVLSTLALNVITAFLLYAKWSVISGFLSQATQFIYFGIILDCFVFAINKKTGAFVLNDFIVTIALQIIAIPVIFIIVVLSAKKHNRGKMPTTYKVSFSVGLGVSMLSSIISKFLLTNVSLNVVVTILNCVLTITIYLIWYIVISAIYRAYLVKRYNLNISLEQSII